MAATWPQLFDRLSECDPAQLGYIEVHLDLPEKFIDQKEAATRARQIIKLLKQRGDDELRDQLAVLLDKVSSGAEGYLGGRLEHLKDFLADSTDLVSTRNELVGTIRQLRAALKEGKKGLEKPLLIKVRGTLFPAALLTEGWWERKQERKNAPKIEWKNPLQEWLFRGFDLWAPLWDICWGATDPKDPSRSYHIAQLTEGDEADSLPVVMGPDKAKIVDEWFLNSWGGLDVDVIGRLGHRFQFDKKLPKTMRRNPLDYYISVEDGNRRHKIIPRTEKTDLYSGYLWKVVAPQEWLENERMLSLNQVYFIWEHTNFVEKQAVEYNLEGLAHKEGLIAKQHRGSNLILLQKSHDIVPGTPAWSVERFYKFHQGEGESA